MIGLSQVIKQSEAEQEAYDLRKEFHEARSSYELALRKFLHLKGDNCPCCFKGFYKEVTDRVKGRAFINGFEPDELEVLEEMFSVTLQLDEECSSDEEGASTETQIH